MRRRLGRSGKRDQLQGVLKVMTDSSTLTCIELRWRLRMLVQLLTTITSSLRSRLQLIMLVEESLQWAPSLIQFTYLTAGCSTMELEITLEQIRVRQLKRQMNPLLWLITLQRVASHLPTSEGRLELESL
jgi:hypothetical protein